MTTTYEYRPSHLNDLASSTEIKRLDSTDYRAIAARERSKAAARWLSSLSFLWNR